MNTGDYTVLQPLFDFQAICDTDLGLYNLIRSEYYDKSIFRQEIFESNDFIFIKTVLLTREYFNPLYVFCKEGVMDHEEMDDLYQQFLDEEYDRIIDLSPHTNIINIASISSSINNLVNPHIVCSCEKEVEWVQKYSDKLDCFIADYKDLDIQQYSTFYVKNLYTLLLLKQDSIKFKTIIFSNFAFNLEKPGTSIGLPVLEIAKRYGAKNKFNKFNSADPYKDITFPVSEMQ